MRRSEGQGCNQRRLSLDSRLSSQQSPLQFRSRGFGSHAPIEAQRGNKTAKWLGSEAGSFKWSAPCDASRIDR